MAILRSGCLRSRTKMLMRNCTFCKRNKSMIVPDELIEVLGLKDFFKKVGEATVNFGKKVANNTWRALKIVGFIGISER